MKEIDDMKDFIARKSDDPVLKKRLHIIWYCLPTDNDRPLSKAEMALFESGTGSVPVIAIFTKFDGLITKAFNQLRNEDGLSRHEAMRGRADRADHLFQERFIDRIKLTEHPPMSHLRLQNTNKPDTSCDELIDRTIEALDDHTLRLLFLSAQQAKVETSIRWALKREILEKYVFAGKILNLMEERSRAAIFAGHVFKWFPHLFVSLRLTVK